MTCPSRRRSAAGTVLAPLGWIHLMRPEVSPTRHTESETACGGGRRGRPRVTLWLLTQVSSSGMLAGTAGTFALAPAPLPPAELLLLPLSLCRTMQGHENVPFPHLSLQCVEQTGGHMHVGVSTCCLRCSMHTVSALLKSPRRQLARVHAGRTCAWHTAGRHACMHARACFTAAGCLGLPLHAGFI